MKKKMLKLLAIIPAVLAVIIGYTALDQWLAKNDAVTACDIARKGASIKPVVEKFKENKYKLIESTADGKKSIYVVSKRGFGRHNCYIEHDGAVITMSKVNFSD